MGSLAILDKDYFIPYLHDELDASRDGQGLPKYRYKYKNNIILDDLINGKKHQEQILRKFRENHSQALDLLTPHNIICMNYNLELDLLCSQKAVELMSNYLGLSPEQSNRRFLLTERKNKIKKLDSILKVLPNLENKNLPNSYKRIKKQLVEISKRC